MLVYSWRKMLSFKGRPYLFSMEFVQQTQNKPAFFGEYRFEYFCPSVTQKISLEHLIKKDRNIKRLKLICDVLRESSIFPCKRYCYIVFKAVFFISKSAIRPQLLPIQMLDKVK